MSIGSDNGLAPPRRQAIIWTNADLDHGRIYAALGEDELTNKLALTPFRSSESSLYGHEMVAVDFITKLYFLMTYSAVIQQCIDDLCFG